MNVLIFALSIVCSILAFAIVYAVITKELSKLSIVIAVYIELCVIAANYFANLGYFALLGVLGVVLPTVANYKKKK